MNTNESRVQSLYSQSYGFSRRHVWFQELDHKEGGVPKNWCFQIVVLEKTLESPLDCKVKPLHPKGNQSWIFTRRTDVEAEAPIFWPPDEKSWLIGKDLTLGKIEGRRRSGQQGMRWLDSITDWMDINLSKLQEIVKDREGKPDMLQSMRSQGVWQDLATEQQEAMRGSSIPPPTLLELHCRS